MFAGRADELKAGPVGPPPLAAVGLDLIGVAGGFACIALTAWFVRLV
jgi:hypothetical protein